MLSCLYVSYSTILTENYWRTVTEIIGHQVIYNVFVQVTKHSEWYKIDHCFLNNKVIWGSVVGIVTRLCARLPKNYDLVPSVNNRIVCAAEFPDSPWGPSRLLLVGTRILSAGKVSQALKVVTYLHLALRSLGRRLYLHSPMCFNGMHWHCYLNSAIYWILHSLCWLLFRISKSQAVIVWGYSFGVNNWYVQNIQCWDWKQIIP